MRTTMTEFAKFEEIKITREKRKYDELGMCIKDPKPTKIIWGSPDTVEMTDKEGNIHTYSIIELLDGSKAFSHWTVYYYYHTKGTKRETKKEK